MLKLSHVKKTFNKGTVTEKRALTGVDLTLNDAIRSVPTVATRVPARRSARLLVSPKSTMEMMTAIRVLDLSIGTILLTSPSESALK